jgi:hypothetical protein
MQRYRDELVALLDELAVHAPPLPDRPASSG